jgi:hypothetical protein
LKLKNEGQQEKRQSLSFLLPFAVFGFGALRFSGERR